MKDENKARLDVAMSKKEQVAKAAETRGKETKLEIKAFLAEFKELRTRVIRPVMEDIAKYLQGRGHACEIDEQEEEVLPNRTRQNAEIRLWITPNAKVATRTHDHPSIAFNASVYGKKVTIHASTMQPGRGGRTASKGEYPPSQITPDLVEKKITEAVADIFT